MLPKINNSKGLALFLIGLLCFIYNTKAQSVGDVSLPTDSFNLGDVLTVNYQFNDDNTITMAIKCNFPGQFFGLGLGNSMLDADIWVFQIINNEVTVGDYYSPLQGFPSLDADIGGQENLERLGYEINSEYTLVKIKRALDTGDAAHDKVIQTGPTNFIYATANSPTLNYHGNARGTAEVVLVNTPVVIPEDLLPEEEAFITEEQENEEFLLEEWENFEENSLEELDNTILVVDDTININ